ncbi:MAG: ARMT1-like domain-containing protein [Desulfobacterales bacterium]|nr:ARMT1-like domain-containing protein [Desulfobacterales bacterium]
MQTSPECTPCLLRQIRYAARLATDDPELEKKVIAQASALLPSLDPEISPPENAIAIYGMISRVSGNCDPFAALKRASNESATALRPELEQRIVAAADPLLAAIRLAVAGNIIDYGSHHDFDIETTVNNCLDRELVRDHYQKFRHDLSRVPEGGTILYLGDNCGELVFDGMVIKMLADMGKRVVLALKEKAIINDALVTDGRELGLDEHCIIISNGTACPGTPLKNCSAELQHFFRTADLIISKGQGNFETLSDTPGPVYFLLTVKCPVVARHLAGPGFDCPQLTGKGEPVLLRHRRWQG